VPSLVATGDVVSDSDAKSIIDQAVTKFGKVDVLINAAGSMNAGAITGQVEPAQWFRDFVSGSSALFVRCVRPDKRSGAYFWN
jgi:NADP-dependent 3-hydroxy acid dehydrogenase YdfG